MKVGPRVSVPSGGIRRGFTPKSVPGCALWLRADMGVTEAGTGVSAWANQGSLGGSFTQSTDANRPSLSTSAELNGRAVIDFTSASSDRLVSGAAAATWNFLHNGDGCTLVVVAAATTTGAFQRLVHTTTSFSPGVGIWVAKEATGGCEVWCANGANPWPFRVAAAHTDGALVSVTRHATDDAVVNDYSVREGGASKGAGAYGAAPSASNAQVTLTVGGSTGAFFGGDVAEIIAYTRPLTTDELVALSAYTTLRYGRAA